MKKAKCINNDGYKSSLTVGKYYEVISDKLADDNDMLKIIDETDESYYYSADYFTQYAIAT
jgi:hypothetical protein